MSKITTKDYYIDGVDYIALNCLWKCLRGGVLLKLGKVKAKEYYKATGMSTGYMTKIIREKKMNRVYLAQLIAIIEKYDEGFDSTDNVPWLLWVYNKNAGKDFKTWEEFRHYAIDVEPRM